MTEKNQLVMIIKNDDGQEIDPKDRRWHLIDNEGGLQAFCTGEYFGDGESAVVFETKETTRGGINCEKCLYRIRKIKAVKL